MAGTSHLLALFPLRKRHQQIQSTTAAKSHDIHPGPQPSRARLATDEYNRKTGTILPRQLVPLPLLSFVGFVADVTFWKSRVHSAYAVPNRRDSHRQKKLTILDKLLLADINIPSNIAISED